MQNQMIELMKQYNEGVLASVQSLAELNMKTFEKLSSAQAEALNAYAESASTHIDALGKVSDVKQLMEAQTAFGRACNEKLAGNLREFTTLFNEARDELTAISEKAVANVTENVEKAGELLKEVA